MNLGRRAFLATTTSALATGIACTQPSTQQTAGAGGTTPPPPPVSKHGQFITDLTSHFLHKTKYGRFDTGTKLKPAAWINVYGLAAVIVNKGRTAAKIHFPNSGEHALRVWYLDGSGKPVSTEIKKSLTVSGLGGSFVVHDATAKNVQHPYDDLGMLADNGKLGLAATASADVSQGLTLDVNTGHVFAGRSYAGHELLFRTEQFADLAALKKYTIKPATGDVYALTDNFNWLSEITSTFELTVDGVKIAPGLEPVENALRCVCITHDSHTAPVPPHVLGHNRHFARLVKQSVDTMMKLPVFIEAQAGEKDPKEVWILNSEDPICNGRIIWES